MKLLRILNKEKKNVGQFLDLSSLKNGSNLEDCYKDLETIANTNVLDILKYIMEHDDSEFDDFDSDALQNPAQNLIYKELFNSFMEVINKKAEIELEVNNKFADIESKYK